MFQCTACGLLSVRNTSCPGCGGMSFIDLEAEDSTSLDGFGEVPGLDEAASALHEIAPPPEEDPVTEEEPEGDLPFGFGGMARAHAPSLPFGFGASSQGLSSLHTDRRVDQPSGESAPVNDPTVEGGSDEVHQTGFEVRDAELTPDSEPAAQSGLPMVPVDVPETSPPEPSAMEVPNLWSGTVVDVRSVYGLERTLQPNGTPADDLSPQAPAWPPFAVVAPEPALLDGLLREPTVEAFRALANEEWGLAQERFELVLATGIDGISLRTAAGIACMEIGDDRAAGLHHLKQAAKLSSGNLTTLHNLALGMAMDGRVEGVERILATVENVPDEGGFVSRMHDARRLMKSSSA